MRLQKFFQELADVIQPTLDPGLASATTPRLRVIYDPGRKTSAVDEVLIGVGHWGANEQPIDHAGVCLNNKGTARRFAHLHDYVTVTDLVLTPPPELEAHWQAVAAGCPDPAALLKRFTLVAEDAGPDSCLAFLCWAARLCGVDVGELIGQNMEPWLRAARRWETTGMADEPYPASWPLLLSSLSHSHFFMTGPDAHARSEALSQELSQAWAEALAFTVALLKRGVDPNAVPVIWEVPGYRRAVAFLDSEDQDYQHSFDHATTLQLHVPLRGRDDHHGLLVDAYFALETWPSGAKKLFVRKDRTHTHLKQGFALMGLYRPDERLRGSGNDMTVSVNPDTGIHLKRLWEELERLETARWEGKRPCGQPRLIASYPPGAGYDQPWWDDKGHYTLLGAPKFVAGGKAGSRLTWPDVVNAAWRCYNPLRDLRVEDLLDGDASRPLPECHRRSLPPAADPSASMKWLVAVRWRPDTEHPSALLGAPTARRYLAALIARGPDEKAIGVEDLPSDGDFDYLPVTGGFAILHDRGVLLFEDWRLERLRLERLIEEMRRVRDLLDLVCQTRVELDTLAQELSAKKRRATPALLADMAALRARLTGAEQRLQPASHWDDVRRFRKTLEQRWGLEGALPEFYKRVVQFEEAVRTDSTLKTQRLVSIIASYGLPFFISGAIVPFLLPANESGVRWWSDLDLTIAKVIFYVGLAVTGIVAIRLINRLKLWRHNRQRRVPDTAGK